MLNLSHLSKLPNAHADASVLDFFQTVAAYVPSGKKNTPTALLPAMEREACREDTPLAPDPTPIMQLFPKKKKDYLVV